MPDSNLSIILSAVFQKGNMNTVICYSKVNLTTVPLSREAGLYPLYSMTAECLNDGCFIIGQNCSPECFMLSDALIDLHVFSISHPWRNHIMLSELAKGCFFFLFIIYLVLPGFQSREDENKYCLVQCGRQNFGPRPLPSLIPSITLMNMFNYVAKGIFMMELRLLVSLYQN